LRSIICLILILGLVFPSSWTIAAYAQEAPAPDNTPAGLNLDLSSTERNVAASTVLSPTASATIDIGGLSRVVSAADMLTAAEFVAVRQVMNTGTQYLQLSDMGAAIGGGLRLNAGLASQINSLVIPTGVHASQNAAVLQNLNLTGNFTNSGVYSILSTNSAISSASINAASIYNNAGALISSTLANLTLNAVNNIVNAGVITSAGNLNLTAGGSISNIGQLAALQAMNNMTLQAANIVNQGSMLAQLGNMNAVTANLVNSGIMQSLNQSLTVQNLNGSILNVTGTGGVMSALRSLSFITQGPQYDVSGSLLAKPAINLEGGTLVAENVNFTSPDGVVRAHAERIDGGVNIVGGMANVGTRQGNLFIQSQVLTGDPIYYAQGGDLDLSGNFNIATGGEDFIGLASGSIIAPTAPVNPIIDTSGVGTGNIVLAAGVDFTVSGGASPISCSDCSLLYTIVQASGTGGDVDLPTVALISDVGNVSIQANAGTAAAGNVSLLSINATFGGADVSINASGDVTLGAASSFAGDDFSVVAGGNITIVDTIDATTVSMLTTGGAGNIALGASINAGTTINLYASGNGAISQTAGTLTVNVLTMTSDLADIGASGQSISTNVLELSANGANVYIANTSAALQLNSSSADNHSGTYGTFELTTTGLLNVPAGAVVYGGTISLEDGDESTVAAGGLVESFGSTGSVSWKTVNFLHNDGEILGHHVLINSDFDLNVDGSGTIGINDMPNSGTTFSGPQSIVSLESLSGGNVTVSQGRIDGLIASSQAIQGAFSFGCFCFVASFINDGTPPTNFSVTVSQGAIYANHILATNQVDLVNNGGDIRIYGQDNWSPGTISTSGVGNINLTTVGSYTILLDRGAVIDSSNNLTINTSYFYNNTSPIFMAGNPAVHAVNDITLQNGIGDLGVSGTGGMWTGIAGVEGTGTINFNATNGSVVVTSARLMGTTNISASTTAGLFVLDLTDSTNFTAGTLEATAPIGFPAPFSATYGTTGITYWQAPSSVNMIDPNVTQGGGLLVLSTVAAVDPSNPTGDTINVLINGDPVVGGPTGVVFPVSCGGSCVNYTGTGMEILSTLQIDGLQTGLMVVHSNMPVTVNGNTSISNEGGTTFNTSTVGVLQTCDLCAGPVQPGITINSIGGNVIFGGGRGGFTSQPNLVTLGALDISNSGGAFIEYGLVQGGSVNIQGSSSRLYSGDIQSTNGDFVINNAGQIDIFNIAAVGGGASVTHTGPGYIDMNFSSIIAAGNLTGTDVSISINDATANGGLIAGMGSNIFTNSGGSIEVSISNGSLRTSTGAKIVSSGTLNITCDTCQDPVQFNDSTIASFGNLSINNSDGDMTFRGASVYTSNADVFITNQAGNLTFVLPGAVRADQLILVDTVFGPFPYSPYGGGNLTVSNAGGNLTVTKGALLTGSDLINGNVAVNNLGGNLELSNFGSIQSPNGRVIVRNAGGNLNINTGGSVTANGNGVSVDNTIMLYNSGGTVNVDTLASSTALQGNNFALIMADQDISIAGLGINAFSLLQLNLISTAGAVQITQQDLSSSPISGQAATSFSATVTNGNLLVDTILANNGSVTLSAESRTTAPAGGSITINPGATIVAVNGTVTVQTCTSASINIGANAFITALDGLIAFNDIFIVSGSIPSAPVLGITPANVVDSTSGGGQIFYGTQGLTALAPDNFINAIGGDIVFDAATVTDITLGGNVTINASIQGISPLLTSLDLQNDSAAVDQVVALQGLGLIGGALVVNSGAAVGGNAVVSASRIAPLLTALNLPANVDIEFSDFGTMLRPITVSLTAGSTTTQAIVAGTSFFNDGLLSNAYINVISDQAGPVVVVDSSAQMVSDRLLSITANGDISVGGVLNAFDQLVVETVEGGGNIAISSNMTGRNVLRLETDSTGDITQTLGTLTGNSIYLFARNGSIGTANARVSAITYDAFLSELRILATGNAFLTYQGDVFLERSLAGGIMDLTTTCAGDIFVNGDYVLGGTINLTADGAGGIFTTFGSSEFKADTINLTSGTGDIGGPNGPSGFDLVVGSETGTITANTGGNVYIQMNGIILCLGCPSGTSDPRPQPAAIVPTTLNVGSSRASSILRISATSYGLSVLPGANISVAGDLGSGIA
jgi:hypothetical protein